MPLHKHFQTVIHAAADKILPIIFPLVVNLISTILYKSWGGGTSACCPVSYLFRLVLNVQEKRTSLYEIITHNYSHNSPL